MMIRLDRRNFSTDIIKKGTVNGRTSQMPKNQICIKVPLWIGMALFLLWFLAFSIAPERLFPLWVSLKITGSFPVCMEFSS
jgi:hypothetical protein